ncbi:helix-turn-helix domain-containing protein [Amycolatopsis nigrescens]|uniref:helix-turn-helix domain-containing protein n=1 Tax=Amycolatopsis nigrescens TaxID=381445 RepID=UPI00037DF1AC|nr:helix-turn-helix transcriptional regulator [Amycolatopsis nigrescens]
MTYPPDDRELGDAVAAELVRARRERGLSQREVCALLGDEFSVSSLCRYEQGKQAMRLEDFVHLCVALRVSPSLVLYDACVKAYHHTNRVPDGYVRLSPKDGTVLQVHEWR